MAAERQPAYHDRIVMDPEIMVGKPTIRGTRIPVELVLEQLSYNLDPGELFAAYPRLTEDDVRACIAYARQCVRRRKARPRGAESDESIRRAAV
ncbi:MAG: DUF433 domain-containing protein [Chloroflexota bacterium]|nr:DUF433 domain-containing protein [Chloroflexota bacterium]